MNKITLRRLVHMLYMCYKCRKYLLVMHLMTGLWDMLFFEQKFLTLTFGSKDYGRTNESLLPYALD